MREALRSGDSASSPKLNLRVLTFCFVAALVDGIDTQTLAIAVPLIAKDWDLPLAAFGPALVAFSAGLVVGSVLAGWAADKVGRKTTLLVAVTTVGFSTLAVPFTGGIALLSVVRFFGGAGVGGALVCIIAICTSLAAGARGSRLALVVYVGAPCGYLIASLVGSRLLASGNWPLLFIISGGITLALAVALAIMFPSLTPSASSVDKAEQQRGGLFGHGRGVRTAMLWVAMLLGFTATFLLLNWLPSILTMAGLSAADAAVSGSVIYVGSIIGTLGFAAAAARWSVGPILGALYALGTVAALVIHVLGPASGWVASAGLLILGIAVIGGQIALMVFSASFYPPQFQGRGVGWAIGVGRLGSLLGPALGAALISSAASRDSVFLVLGALVGACTVVIAILSWMLMTGRATDQSHTG
ncbi:MULTISPECIES: MFS transporter [unclassified Sphingomonas]|uniref:MFS transporter n=1 Tax=unclassified Sphingomonas TaxID=196159 RepID=UPI00082F3A4E|nr:MULTISPECIES: MFS transporter [unclassified Sphingomonas]